MGKNDDMRYLRLIAEVTEMYDALKVLLKAAQGLDATAFRGSRFPGPEPAHEAYLKAYDKAKDVLDRIDGNS